MIKVGLFAYGETGLAALRGLIRGFDILWIIVPPKGKLPVVDYGKSQKIPVVETDSIEEIFGLVKKTEPDIVVISSFNKILPEKILSLSKFINVHHGDLARWRGRANINWAIILGRKNIGLTFHEAIADLDAGNIFAQYKVPITRKDTVKTVYDRFNQIIEKNISRIVRKILKGFRGRPQKRSPTYCCTRLPEDGYIDWSKTSEEIYNLIRALTKPYPGAFTYFQGKKMIIWDSEIPKNPKIYEGRIPGRITKIYKNYGVEVLTDDSSIVIKTVNYAGSDLNASKMIRSVRNTLGLNIVEIYEKVANY